MLRRNLYPIARRTIVCAILMYGFSTARADASGAPSFAEMSHLVSFPSADPVGLGWGWDSREVSHKKKICISFLPEKQDWSNRAMKFSVVDDNESLAHALNISASAKYRGITGGSVSFGANFARDTKFDVSATTIALLAEVMQAPDVVTPASPDGVALLPDLVTLARTNLTEFRRQCGDSFVSVIHKGAKLNGVLIYRNTSEAERNNIAASLAGSGFGGFEGNVSFSAITDRYVSSNSFSAVFETLGGDGTVFATSRETLMKALETLSVESQRAPKEFEMVIQKYDSLSNWPVSPVTYDLTDQEVLGSAYYRLLTLRSFTNDALTSQQEWMLKFDTTAEHVGQLQMQLDEELDQIRKVAKECETHSSCDTAKWRDWTDLDYRARMPLKMRFSELSYSTLDDIPSAVAAARYRFWIQRPAAERCRLDPHDRNSCSYAKYSPYRDLIEKKVRASFG